MMSEEKALSVGKNGADKLVLQEIHSRLDWVSNSSTKIHHMEALKKEGYIENYRFDNLEIKINGTWYKQP